MSSREHDDRDPVPVCDTDANVVRIRLESLF